MTDTRQGVLNPLAVNCLRDFPNVGTAVFGARTLVTVTDEQWRYVPVRRMALFRAILVASLGFAVFEPNADPLWSAIRMSVNAFMLGLFRQGAFKGTTPSQAFRFSATPRQRPDRHRQGHRQHRGRFRTAQARGVRRDLHRSARRPITDQITRPGPFLRR